MSVGNVIKLSKLEGAKRFDAEYYQPVYLEARNKILNIPFKTISTMSESVISFGAYSLCNYIIWRETGIPYLKAENIKEGYIDFDETMFIDEKVHHILNKSQVKEGQVLFSMSGTIGNVAVAHKIPLVLNSNQDIAKITLKKGYSPYYIAAFLNSKYGRLQTQREIVGSVQQHVFLWQTKKLKIPTIAKRVVLEVEKLFKQGLDELTVSKSLYTQAGNLLLQELGLNEFKIKHKLSYSTSLSKTVNVHRMDAEYFQPAYDKLEEYLINNFSAKPIKKFSFIAVTTGQYSERYVEKEEGRPYIRGTNIKNGTINVDDLVYISPKDQIESKKAKEGDVVVTRVGSIGLSARIPKECKMGTISDNLIRLRFDQEKLNSYYLALYLGSIIGVSLMVRNSRGSVQQRLNQETLKDVVIPVLGDKTQQKIASLVQKSHEARTAGLDLLKEAERKVEQEIERESR